MVSAKGPATATAGGVVREVVHRIGLQVSHCGDLQEKASGGGVREDREVKPVGDTRDPGGQGLCHLCQHAG